MLDLPNTGGLLVAVDTETSGLHVDDGARMSAISIAFREDGELRSMAFPFDHGPLDKGGKVKASLFDVDINMSRQDHLTLMMWLENQYHIYHKAYFDLQILNKGHRKWGHGADFLMQTVWDTKLAQWVIEPNENTSLKPTCSRLWGEDEAAEQAALQPFLSKNGNRFDLVPWEVMEPYSAKDAELTYRLYEWQQEYLSQGFEFLRSHIEKEIDVMRVLTKSSYRGIGYDMKASLKEGVKAQSMMNMIDRELPFRPTPPGAAKYFFDTKDAIPHCMTAGGKPSVQECCVRSLIAQNVEGADQWATRMKLSHAISAYYVGFAKACGEDGRLRTDWKQDGTVTMRFSSNRVNLQALPHDYQLDRINDLVMPRALFTAAPGWELWEFDLAQAEARVAASVAGCETWLQMFRDGRDLHSETAMRLFSSSEKRYRQVAKRANFALIYSVGWSTFQKDVEKHTGLKLTDEEAQDVVKGWRALYPEFQRINKRAEQVASRKGYVTLMDGRQRFFKPFEELHKAFNAVIQGSISCFVKQWMIAVDDDECARILLQVHDSIVVEIPSDGVEIVSKGITDYAAREATKFFKVPMSSDAKPWVAA